MNIAYYDAEQVERLLDYPKRVPKHHSSIIQRLRWHFGGRAPLHTS